MPSFLINTDEIYTIEDAAKVLNKGVATLWRWIRDGKIHVLRLSGRTLIPKSEVERLKKD